MVAMATLTAGNFSRRPGWRTKYRVVPAAAARGEIVTGRGCALFGAEEVGVRVSGWWWKCVCVWGGSAPSWASSVPPFCLEMKGASSESLRDRPVELLPGAFHGNPQLFPVGSLTLPQSRLRSASVFPS